MDEKKIITSDKLPKAIGPYSVGTVFEKLVFTSGQLGLDPQSGNFATDEVKGQTRQALENLSEVLKAAGSDLKHVLKTTVFLRDMNDFAAMNEIYANYFVELPPARSAVEVAKLPKNAAVEIEAIAFIP